MINNDLQNTSKKTKLSNTNSTKTGVNSGALKGYAVALVLLLFNDINIMWYDIVLDTSICK